MGTVSFFYLETKELLIPPLLWPSLLELSKAIRLGGCGKRILYTKEEESCEDSPCFPAQY